MAEEPEMIWERLSASRCSPKDVPTIHKSGVYAFFLASEAAFSQVVTDASRLLYIGKTKSSLAERNHLLHKASGFSTPRRSIGAILKQEIRLQSVPRSLGISGSNIANFSFAPDGEKRLTDWMMSHLNYGLVAVKDPDSIEKRLISEQRPPLNLNGWKNPQGRHIKALRKLCKLEASRAASGGDMTAL